MEENLPFEKWHQQFEEDFTVIGRSMEELSSLYEKLPVPEAVKKRFIDTSLKNKSAWYACLVNSNIDHHLLPEYLESRQSRNILIKKETDQYFKSVDNFNLLQAKSNSSLYEHILLQGDQPQNSGVDLFSSQLSDSSVKCPKALQSIFANWNTSFRDYGDLESTVYGLVEWHAQNQYSFSSRRQTVLWFSYRLWKQFGQAAFCLNIEHYLFQKWQKESVPGANIKDLILFLKSEIERNREALNVLFKEHILFTELKPGQKLVSNFLFSIGFDMLAQEEQQPLMKILLRKGYLELSDIDQKSDPEKVKSDAAAWFEKGLIFMVNEDGERYISLNPSYSEKADRLSKFNNIRILKRELEWDEFISQLVTKPIAPKATMPVPDAEPVMAKPARRQKAFFG
jgi:hypothetical protein